ncbi:uncharacterized protein [Henckelia pumila]|uniref:uncharacterized protein n=1 Tax=Henckelia pumila TaxID=405737 RepID=UPI003C6E6061
MNLLAWNARGLGNPRAIRELRRLIVVSNPSFLFISETKLLSHQCRQWLRGFQFDGCFSVDCDRRRGESLQWRFTGFYGNPEASFHSSSWELLRRIYGIHELQQLPWLVGGDFNEILFESEKMGGLVRPLPQMKDFADALVDCGLQDLSCIGDPFTWSNKRKDFVQYVQQCWDKSRGLPDHPAILSRFSRDLSIWAGQRFNNLGKKIKLLRDELNWLQCSSFAKDNYNRILALEKEIEKLYDQEEIHWKQRSRVNWLSQGDRNTKFFHSSASTRCQNKLIKGLFNSLGEWFDDEPNMVGITTDYFSSLFASSNPSQSDIESVLEFINPIVNNHMNDILCTPFTAEEIRKVMFEMHPSKSPGPDGFTALFYKKLL